ncbi:MAG TPA: FAD-dependent oxidoreductase, partial [Thermomicrobiales bacterium]|nr:FAD-dependent oxidoreductase [Thermomicrobiales bacterium]
TARQIASRWPGFRAGEGDRGAFERRAGYLEVEACVLAHLEQARALGAELLVDRPVRSWRAERSGVVVETERGPFSAGALIIAAGPWAAEFLGDLGVRFEVRRKSLFWFESLETAYDAGGGCPCFLFETPVGVYYGMPRVDSWGVKIAEHTGGAVVSDPLAVNRTLEPAERRRVEQFISASLPQISRRMTRHSVCMYTMSPDAHFVVDRHPAHPQVAFAAGLSGHGFKFAGVLGEALADLTLDGRTSLPIEFLAAARPTIKASLTTP